MAVLGFCDKNGRPLCNQSWIDVHDAVEKMLPGLYVDAESSGWISVRKKREYDEKNGTVVVCIGDRKPGDVDEWGGVDYDRPGLEVVATNSGVHKFDTTKPTDEYGRHPFVGTEGAGPVGRPVFFDGEKIDDVATDPDLLLAVAAAVRFLIHKHDKS